MLFSFELLLIPLGLSFVHIFGILGNYYIKGSVDSLRSFAAGFSVAYVFLMILPELSRLSFVANMNTFLLSLVGFVLFHEAHKSIFKHNSGIYRLRLIDEIHLITIGLYSFLITFFLVEIVKIDLLQGVTAGAIISVHFLLSEISQTKTKSIKKRGFKLPVTIGATFLGGFLAAFNLTGELIAISLFALTAGALIYIAIREEIPQKDRGRPLFYLAGTLLLVIAKAILF